MANKKVRMTVEFDVNEDMLQEYGLSAEDVLNGVYLREDDICDGFQITTNIAGFNPTSDFFLENGVVVDKMLVDREKSLDEQIAQCEARVNDRDLGTGIIDKER